MKHRQVTAVLLSIIIAVSACVPMNGLGAFAAESAESSESADEAEENGTIEEDDAAEEVDAHEHDSTIEEANSTEDNDTTGVADADDTVEQAGTAEGDGSTTDAATTEDVATIEGDDSPDAADLGDATEEAATTDAADAGDDGATDDSGTTAVAAADDDGTTDGDGTNEQAATSEQAAAAAATTSGQTVDPEDIAAAATAEGNATADTINTFELSDDAEEGGSREAMGAATQIPVEDLLSREVIPTNVTSPSSGCVLAGVPGEFASDPDAVLARINEIRREACEEGVRNPSNGKPLTMDDYVPIKWSRDLEYIARIRAAESAFVVKHGRANGTKWNTLESPDGVKTYAENCSRNDSNSVIYGIDSWYKEKADWVNQTPGAETGHYTNMIRPSYEYVGLSTFLSDDFANCNTTVAEFTFESGLDESRIDFIGECIQMLEMTASNLSAEGEIVGDLGGEIGEKSKHLLATKASFSYAGTVYLLDGVTWSSSDTSVVTISSDGETTIKGPGSAVIRASFGNGSITAEAEFVKRVEDSTIDLSPASFTYDGTEKEPEVTVTYDGVKLTEGTDYTLSFSNNVNAGTAKVTVTGIGEYGGTAEKTFTIEKAEQPLACAQDKSIIEVGTILPFTVTGCQTTPSFNNWDPDIVSLDVAEGDVSGTITALKPGGAYIIVTTPENANYKSAYASIYIQVEKAGIYNADITVTDAVYDGTPKIPEVQVSFAGKILTEGTDYTVTCGSNIDAGTYYVTIKGIGDYQYSTRKSYKILKAEQTFTAADLSLHPYEQAKVTVTGAQGALTYQSADTAVATVSKDGTVTANQAGTAQITVSAAGSGNYNAGSATLTVTVTPYDLSSSECTAELGQTTFSYDGTQKKPEVASVKFGTLTLTEGTDYTVSYKNNTNVGTASAIITGNSKTTTGSKTLTFTITKSEQTITAEDMSLHPYEKAKVKVTGALGDLTYESSDPAVAAVAEDGTVTAGQAGAGGQPGTAQITVTSAETDNCGPASTTLTVTVTPYDLSSSDCAAELKTSSYTYNGKARKPAVSYVKFGDVTLTEGTDYTVSYKNNKNAGTASVIITGNDKTTTGSKTLTFTITKAKQTFTAEDLSLHPYEQGKVTVTGAKGALTYQSSDMAVATVAEDGTVTAVSTGTEGQAGADGQYGTAQITVSAAETDNYKAGSATLTVTVTAYDLSSSECTAELAEEDLTETKLAYDGTQKKPAVAFVKYGDLTLKEGTDYTVTYGENVNVGTGTVIINGNDKITTGSKTLTFTITKSEQAITAEDMDLHPYEQDKVKVTGALGDLKYESSDTAVAAVAEDGTVTAGQTGTAQITVTSAETDNCGPASTTLTVTVTPYDLSSSDCIAELKTSSYTYNGKARKPAVSYVKFGDVTLTSGTDYTVSYKNNKNAGTASVIITGNDKTTTGSKTLNFTITKAKQTITAEDMNLYPYEQGKVTVTGAKGALTYQSSDTAVATVAEDGTVTAVQAGQAGTEGQVGTEDQPGAAGQPGTAQITVNAAETDNYKAGSTTLTVTVTAYDLSSEQCEAELAKTDPMELVYDGTQKKLAVASVKFGDLTLTEGTDYTVTYGENVNAGTGTVIINGNDKITAGSKTLNFTIGKAEQTLSADGLKLWAGASAKAIVKGAQGALTYEIADTEIATVADDGTVTAVAEGTTKLTISAAETENYNASEAIEITVEVGPSTIDVSELEITVNDAGLVYNGKAREPKVTVRYDGEVVTEGYSVEHQNNIDAGYKTAKVIITGDGDVFEGTREVEFTILPGKTGRGDMFNLANNVKVTWKEVPGAKYYKIYREGITDPSESRTEPVIVTERLIGWDKQPGLTNGHAYRYKIVASLTGKGDPSGDSPLSYSKFMYRLKTVVIRSAKNTAPGKVTVKYDRTTSGDSYVLQYGERQDMVGAKTKVVLGAENTSYVIGGLKKGKTYYISIRVRKKVDGIDYYTTFGVAKKVTITK